MIKEDHPGLLSAGFHDATLDDLRAWCVEAFPYSVRRPLLFARLCEFLRACAQTGLRGHVWLDGSFITRKPEPEDVDLVIFFTPESTVTPAGAAWLTAHFAHGEAKARFLCDAYLAPDELDQRAYWRGLFGFMRDETTPKGIAVCQLEAPPPAPAAATTEPAQEGGTA